MAKPRDSRNIVTQEAFSVAPHLLGLPLARPSRRLAAILLDLVLVSILANVGGPVLLGLAAAFAFFRFASRALGSRGKLGATARFAFRLAGSVVLFIVAVAVLNAVIGRVRDAEVEVDGRTVSVGDVARMASGAAALSSAADSAEALRAARQFVDAMRKSGTPEATIRAELTEAAEENPRPWAVRVAERALARPDSAAAAHQLPPDSMALAYAAAVANRDSAAVDSLRPRLGSLLASDSLQGYRERVGELEGGNRRLARELEEERNKGLLARLLNFLEDLGIGFGWTGLYFTAFTALWKGQTPAKRLLGIRVLRLNGQPMTLWASFERFGGYAAGLLTGLLGFAQVYWDRNRQAIHDKITETVVVRERKGQTPLPGPHPAA
jgi:hypothetical protein